MDLREKLIMEPVQKGLSGAASAVWAIMAPRLRNASPELLRAFYKRLQAWHEGAVLSVLADTGIPVEMWYEVLRYLSAEDLARLAQVNQSLREAVELMRPPGEVKPTSRASLPDDFVRTIYTQSELDQSLGERRRPMFTPGEGSDLTIWSGRPHLYGPGRLSAVTGGWVETHRDAHITRVVDGEVIAGSSTTITTVEGGDVYASKQAAITTVNGGEVSITGQATITDVTGGQINAGGQVTIGSMAGGTLSAQEQVTITTVTGGTADIFHNATITHVTGGTVNASDQAAITHVTGGTVNASGQTTITHVTGGTVNASGQTTITAASGVAHIIVSDHAQVTISANADIHVDAYGQSVINAYGGTVNVHSPNVTVNNEGATLTHH
ncbi:F-box protein [Streptomyces sp. NBC_01264]|uniref:F-box protein n=1 Tax=Streptomyces sp. NBC_01264 TaxID=2903804 RepID=UPI00224EFD6E|nr:F-box protein [Streptomyces sp. NBC_01264]MCX4784171.1 hypothetical protein [Streptomyces sp. NBC_01264]